MKARSEEIHSKSTQVYQIFLRTDRTEVEWIYATIKCSQFIHYNLN